MARNHKETNSRSKTGRRRPANPGQALFTGDFFIAVPAEWYTAMTESRLTPPMWCVYSMVLRQVDFETSVWWGTAFRIYKDWGGQIHLRTVQDNLAKLCESGALKSFHERNARGAYPVLVHGYKIRFGLRKGLRLNAEATVDPSNPVYYRDNASEQPPHEVQDGAPEKSLETKHQGRAGTATASSELSGQQRGSAQPPRNDRESYCAYSRYSRRPRQ